MKRDQYWSKPKDAKVRDGDAEAWYYVDKGGIELHVHPVNSVNHITVRLARSELVRYVNRSK